jgi:replication factor C small subunit
LLDTMLKHGLSGSDIIKQIQRELWNLQIDDRSKVKLIDKCGEIEFRMTEGSDEYIQLEAFLAYLTLGKNS